MALTIRITGLDNAALRVEGDGHLDNIELARIIRNTADEIEITNHCDDGFIRDFNGNKIGWWKLRARRVSK